MKCTKSCGRRGDGILSCESRWCPFTYRGDDDDWRQLYGRVLQLESAIRWLRARPKASREAFAMMLKARGIEV